MPVNRHAAFLSVVGLIAALSVGEARAATNPWFGVWKLRIERSDQTPETLVYSEAGGGAMRMVSVEDRSELVTRLDGAPSADVGAGGRRDWTLAVRATSPTRYVWTFAKSGKPVAEGVNTLSDDLKTFRR